MDLNKIISYAITDPFGNFCIVSGSYATIDKVLPLTISLPITAIGIAHLIDIFNTRSKLNKEIQEFGLNEKTLNRYNQNAWCTHRMVISYLKEKQKYSEFKDKIQPHSYYHYFKRGIRRNKIRAKKLKRKFNLVYEKLIYKLIN